MVAARGVQYDARSMSDLHDSLRDERASGGEGHRPSAVLKPQRLADRMPAAAILAWLGLAAIVVAVILAVEVRSPRAVTMLEERASSSEEITSAPQDAPTDATTSSASAQAEAPPPASTLASAHDLDAARLEGPAAIEALAKKFPDDPSVLKSLVLARMQAKPDFAKAIEALRHLLEVDPKSAADKDVQTALTRLANGPVPIAKIALEIISTKMGAEGPTLLYDMVTAPGIGAFPKSQARQLLASPKVVALASPDVRVAFKLHTSKTCPDKTLLASARDEGDSRTLGQLQQLLTPIKCGFLKMAKCYKCTASQKAMMEAVNAINKRRQGNSN